MGRYLDELYKIYLELEDQEEYLDFRIYSPVEGEFGEVCLMKAGLFLLTGTSGRFCTGYKVSPWVDFATSRDMVFRFDSMKWVAILEHELWVPNDELVAIGMMDQDDLEIFYNCYINKKPIPESHSGLTIPENDENYIQNKFRAKEMAKVLKYILSQFQALQELEESAVIEANKATESKKVIDLSTFKKIFSEKIKLTEFPLAAASSTKSASGENFYLFYENGLLIIKIDSDYISNGLMKVEFDSEEYIVIAENDTIEIEIMEDYLPLDYLAHKIRIYNVQHIEES